MIHEISKHSLRPSTRTKRISVGARAAFSDLFYYEASVKIQKVMF